MRRGFRNLALDSRRLGCYLFSMNGYAPKIYDFKPRPEAIVVVHTRFGAFLCDMVSGIRVHRATKTRAKRPTGNPDMADKPNSDPFPRAEIQGRDAGFVEILGGTGVAGNSAGNC